MFFNDFKYHAATKTARPARLVSNMSVAFADMKIALVFFIGFSFDTYRERSL